MLEVGKTCKDHLGLEYKSVNAMCKHYGIYASTYNYRISKGWGLKEALTASSKQHVKLRQGEDFERINGCIKDHLGNPYCSLKNMCKCWHISRQAYYNRVLDGCTLEQCLTRNNNISTPDKDNDVVWVLGEPFAGYSDVDSKYGLSHGTSKKHKDNIDEWIIGITKHVVDGTVYNSIAEVAAAYGMTEDAVYYRIKVNKLSVQEAVHKPLAKRRGGNKCKDHLGNEYNSIIEMVASYGISYRQYRRRLSNGWSLERTLTEPMGKKLTSVCE